jgi:hypothetical protein
MKTVLLEPGNANVRELDVDHRLRVVASRPLANVFTGMFLAEEPKPGEIPRIRITKRGNPAPLNVRIAAVAGSADVLNRPRKETAQAPSSPPPQRHKLTFGRKPRAPKRPALIILPARACRVCGCTQADCRQCIVRTGAPCDWAAEDLCTACVDSPAADPAVALPGPESFPGEDFPAAPVAPPADPDALRIRITRCNDTLVAHGFRNGQVVVVENCGRGCVYVKSPRDGSDVVILDSECSPVYPQEDAA